MNPTTRSQTLRGGSNSGSLIVLVIGTMGAVAEGWTRMMAVVALRSAGFTSASKMGCSDVWDIVEVVDSRKSVDTRAMQRP